MGANKRHDPVLTQGLNRVLVHGSFRPNGASGIVTDSEKGKGWSVARTSAGLYTITFDDAYNDLVDCKGFVRAATAAPTIVTGGDYVAASKTLQLRVWQGATGAVTLTKPVGHIPLSLFNAREVFSNNVGAAADGAAQGSGGVLCSDTTPILERVNGATDKQIRIKWAASNSDEIMFEPFVWPADLDDTAAVTFKVLAAVVKAGGSVVDSPVLTVSAFEGIGDSTFGGDTAAVAADGTPTVYSVALAAANVAAAPQPVSLGLVPAAHTTDAVALYGAWLEYTRKTWAATETGMVWALTDLSADVDAEVHFNAIFRNTSVDY